MALNRQHPLLLHLLVLLAGKQAKSPTDFPVNKVVLGFNQVSSIE